MKVEDIVREKFARLNQSLDERTRRLWAGTEADAIGHGGIVCVARATGLAISTVTLGRNEIRAGASMDDVVSVRRKGGGRWPHEETQPKLLSLLEQFVAPVTRGDPESPLRWSSKSTRTLSEEIFRAHGISVCDKTVARLLRKLGYSLQAARKTVEGKQHPDRNAQFEFINDKATSCMELGIPFISVDTKKKELVGNFKNAGREWYLKGQPELVDVHDFPSDALGKAIPYGILDVADNSGFVNVGIDHDTPFFAVTSIETWWKRMGSKRYPGVYQLFISADSGGSNSSRSRVWKASLQHFADRSRLSIHVSHLPPGTSKWNKIEHRLFSFISLNWRGHPLRTYETVVNLIGNTSTAEGLVVSAKLDRRKYPLGKKVSKKEMDSLNIERNDFHGDWNYTLHPKFERRKNN